MQRTGSNKLQFFSEIPYIINYKDIIKIKGQGKKHFNFKWWILWGVIISYLLPKGKFGYKAPQVFQYVLQVL